jgi:hypothetical protein
LHLCLDFEDLPLVPISRDGSGLAHDATTANVTSVVRANEHAAEVGPSSSISVASTPDFEMAKALTIEMWVQPQVLPISGFLSPLAKSNEYALTLDHKGTVGCWIGGFNLQGGTIDGAWHHVACTYDGNEVRTYVDGNATACVQHAGTVPTGASPITIGTSPYAGGVDNTRVYARTLAEDDICHLATGGGGCTGCPSPGGGGG